jgi:methylated-DNA-[protein]-cysteine S-methyltransferase
MNAARGVVEGAIDTVFGPAFARLDAEGRLTVLEFRDARADTAARDLAELDDVARQLAEYGSGARRAFSLPLAPEGGAFQQTVWAALQRIPYGETMSYGALAAAIGKPGAARAVGRANGTNPVALVIPCHRVIGADGALVGYGGGLPLKATMLAFEREHAGAQPSLFARS